MSLYYLKAAGRQAGRKQKKDLFFSDDPSSHQYKIIIPPLSSPTPTPTPRTSLHFTSLHFASLSLSVFYRTQRLNKTQARQGNRKKKEETDQNIYLLIQERKKARKKKRAKKEKMMFRREVVRRATSSTTAHQMMMGRRGGSNYYYFGRPGGTGGGRTIGRSFSFFTNNNNNIIKKNFSSMTMTMMNGGGSSEVVVQQPHHHPHHVHVQQQVQNHFQQQQQQQRRSLHLSPRESDHLTLHNAGRLAQYRLARGLKLNYPEAIALITMQMMEHIRDGQTSVADLMSLGQSLLGTNQVMKGISKLIKDVQIEATFPDGTKLLTVHSPISRLDGNLEEALKGSFLPIPDLALFHDENDETDENGDNGDNSISYPGQVMTDPKASDITLNEGRSTIEISVTNTGDRPVQVRFTARYVYVVDVTTPHHITSDHIIR